MFFRWFSYVLPLRGSQVLAASVVTLSAAISSLADAADLGAGAWTAALQILEDAPQVPPGGRGHIKGDHGENSSDDLEIKHVRNFGDI